MRPRPAVFPLLSVSLALALSACGAERAVEEQAGAATGAVADVIEAIEPATEPAAASEAIPASGDARMDGYGALLFGMPAEAAVAKWTGNPLQAAGEVDDAMACHYLVPAGQDARDGLAFMFEGGVFVRYGTGSDAITAPGGGRVGMDEAALDGLYGGRFEATPHKYVEGGKVLSSAVDGGIRPSRLVFELGADGRASRWRVGLEPQVDYVEGCG